MSRKYNKLGYGRFSWTPASSSIAVYIIDWFLPCRRLAALVPVRVATRELVRTTSGRR